MQCLLDVTLKETPRGPTEVVVPVRRIKAAAAAAGDSGGSSGSDNSGDGSGVIKGRFVARAPGELRLIFCNRFSYLRGKEVFFRTTPAPLKADQGYDSSGE